MSVRFKFRSSVTFDTIELNNQPSISVQDLRSKIVDQKNLKICHDFDLVISDSVTGQEYEDDDYLVPSGSSVIIKRVPAGREAPPVLPRTDAVENVAIKQTDPIHTNQPSPPKNGNMENFDDFGVDFYPALGEALLDSDPYVDKITTGREDNTVPRYSETSIVRCQNLESSDLSEADEKGAIQCNIQVDTLRKDLKFKMEERKMLDKVVDLSSSAMQKFDLPSELRCSLCNAIFKDAVMIPCCQHSFCEKCIRSVLVEKARCPKCSSSKCKVEDLLPNVSLRQAIEHFLESQMLISGSDNIPPIYAPDGESGIQAKEVSCAVSVRQREPALPHSPSATGKGSNQVMTESAYQSVMKNKRPSFHLDASGKSVKSASSSDKIKQRNGERNVVAFPGNFRNAPQSLKSVTDFQGESHPVELPPRVMQEANSATRRKGSSANIPDGVGCFAAPSKHRKGDRTCYMCGSPDHLIRDCPAASGQYPVAQTGDAMYPGNMPGYGPSYWQGASFPNISPYGNMYNAPGMMPFTPAMVPVTPFQVPSYMPTMYGGLSVPSGFMRTGGLVSPMGTGAERPVSQAEFMELQESERRHKLFTEHQKREKPFGRDPDEVYRYSQLSHGSKPHLDRENSASFSGNSDTQRPQKKHPHYKHPDEDPYPVEQRSRSSTSGRERKTYHQDVSTSKKQELSGSSNQNARDRHKHRDRTSTKYSEIREQCDNDFVRRSHYQSQKEVGNDRKRVEIDVKSRSRRHHSQSESGLEQSSSGDQKRQRKEKESSHSSKHSKHKLKSRDDELSLERWEMRDGLDKKNIEDYHHHHKRKRRH